MPHKRIPTAKCLFEFVIFVLLLLAIRLCSLLPGKVGNSSRVALKVQLQQEQKTFKHRLILTIVAKVASTLRLIMDSVQQNGDASILGLLSQIQASISSMQSDYTRLAASVDALDGKVNALSGIKQVNDGVKNNRGPEEENSISKNSTPTAQAISTPPSEPRSSLDMERPSKSYLSSDRTTLSSSPNRSTGTSRIILTTYPGQSGIDPFAMDWGNEDPKLRGPVVVSRNSRTVRRRNGEFESRRKKSRHLLKHVSSHWRPRRLILNLSCSCRCQ